MHRRPRGGLPSAGCRDADVLLVDGGMVPHLVADWSRIAASTMRHGEIYIHDRQSFALRKVTSVDG